MPRTGPAVLVVLSRWIIGKSTTCVDLHPTWRALLCQCPDFLALPSTINSQPSTFLEAALSGPKRPTPTDCVLISQGHNPPNQFFPFFPRGEKNLSGPRRTYADRSGPTAAVGCKERTRPRVPWSAPPPAAKGPVEVFMLHSALRISPGPTTRQYPAIRGRRSNSLPCIAA
jgi:hypothetical protein